MPAILLYLNKEDVRGVIDWLNAEEVIAPIVSDGPKRWKAVNKIEGYEDSNYCLWHSESGPLPLLRVSPSWLKWDLPDGKIKDPWKGWEEKRSGADPTVPYFGPGCTGVYWFEAITSHPSDPECIGMSSFSWIGNWYKIIGNEAPPVTKKWWERMRRWIKKKSVKIPREGPLDGEFPEIWVFPSALEEIKQGRKRADNVI